MSGAIRRGTLFALYPQADGSFPEPEIVEVSSPAGSLGPGPSDGWLAVVDAVGKPPYEPPADAPPWRGPVRAPALPDANGDFAWIPPGLPEFDQQHLFGCMRLALDVWEIYFGRPAPVGRLGLHDRFELIPHVEWDNAQSGFGFLETGARTNDRGQLSRFCLNLDVVAHETGHMALFAELGAPAPGRLTAEFLAFHESFSDLTAMLASLRLEAVVARVLERTGGNLYVLNEMSRIGELSGTQQIRVADNVVRMADLAGLSVTPEGEWIDPAGEDRNAHDLAQPLTGALFDFLVDVYQDRLVARGLIGPALDARDWSREAMAASLAGLAAAFAARFGLFRDEFRAALLEARDVLGMALAGLVERADPDGFTFDAAGETLVDVVRARFPARYAAMLREDLAWRGIAPSRPREREAGVASRIRYTPLRAFSAQRAAAARACCAGRRGVLDQGLATSVGRMIRRGHRTPET
jgi:hypothetical protein